MSDSKKKKPAAPLPAEGENGTAPAKARKAKPISQLAILSESPDGGVQSMKLDDIPVEGLQEADLAGIIEKLPVGNYILRRYYDRPLVKAEIKRSSIKIG
jgi:hypothetical protein